MTWNDVTLGDVMTLQRGHDLPKAQRRPGNIPIVSSSGVSGTHDTAKAKAPGVVTGRYGTLGEVFYITEDYWPLNTALYVKDFKGNHPRFAAYLLETMNLAGSNASSAVPGVNRNHLHKLKLRVPPLPTQRRIASILSAYDDLIENNTKRIEILEEMARSLYREWFVHFRFPGREKVKLVDSELGKIPAGWAVVPLSEVFDTSSGGTPSRKHPEYYGNGEIPWVKTRELNDTWIIDTEEKITELGLKKSSAKLFPKGTLLVAMYGATVGMLGVLGLDACTNQACCAVLPKNGSAFGLAFARGYFFEIRQQLIGQALGAAQPNISQQVICRQPVVRPPESLAGSFEETSGPILELSGNLVRKNEVLRQTRDLLLPKLISGEIDVDALDFPEAS